MTDHSYRRNYSILQQRHNKNNIILIELCPVMDIIAILMKDSLTLYRTMSWLDQLIDLS